MQLLINQQQPFVACDQNRTYLSMKIMELKLWLICILFQIIKTGKNENHWNNDWAYPQNNNSSTPTRKQAVDNRDSVNDHRHKQSLTRHKTIDIVWNFYGINWNADVCDWCSQNLGMIENRNRIVLCSKDVCCRPRMGNPAVDQWFIFWTPGKLCWADTFHIFNETFRRLCLLIK